MLNIFSFVYFMWLFAAIVLFFLVHFLFKDKNAKTKYYILVGFAVFTWVNHFSRYWLDPDYQTFKILFQDFCGFNTMMLPFLLLSRKQVAYDIMFLCGALFAFHSLAYPNNIEGDPILYFNTIRFFFAHFLLVSIPIWMIVWGLYTPDIKNVKWAFLYLIIGAMYNLGLSAAMLEMNLVGRLYNFMGLWGNTDSVYRISEKIAPFFRYSVEVNGVVTSKPIPFLYMLPTLIIVYVPIWVGMTYPFIKRKKVMK